MEIHKGKAWLIWRLPLNVSLFNLRIISDCIPSVLGEYKETCSVPGQWSENEPSYVMWRWDCWLVSEKQVRLRRNRDAKPSSLCQTYHIDWNDCEKWAVRQQFWSVGQYACHILDMHWFAVKSFLHLASCKCYKICMCLVLVAFWTDRLCCILLKSPLCLYLFFFHLKQLFSINHIV